MNRMRNNTIYIKTTQILELIPGLKINMEIIDLLGININQIIIKKSINSIENMVQISVMVKRRIKGM